MLVLVVGHKAMRMSFGETAGVLAGMQTHPAVLSYVNDVTRNDLPAQGYTSVYPVSMVTMPSCWDMPGSNSAFDDAASLGSPARDRDCAFVAVKGIQRVRSTRGRTKNARVITPR